MSLPTAPITTRDGHAGTATVEPGKRGGTVVVIRRGFPVAAETVAAVPMSHLSLLDHFLDRDSMLTVAALRS